jgi:hypothetical protein
MEAAADSPKPTLVVILSHHADGGLYFDDDKDPWIPSMRARIFGDGSAVVMAACSSGALSQKHTDVIDDLNDAGMDAAVLAPFDIPTRAGVLFAGAFAHNVVRVRNARGNALLSDVFEEAKDDALRNAANDYRVRSAIDEFFLAGNGALRLCGKEQ